MCTICVPFVCSFPQLLLIASELKNILRFLWKKYWKPEIHLGKYRKV